MAKKKLNKKVAIVGSIFLGLFVILAICAILYKTQGPEKFIKDGDVAFASKNYELAVKKYASALSRAKKNEDKVPILFKLAEANKANNDWQKVLGCYRRIMTADTSNVPARVHYLDYVYDSAQNGQGNAWKEVLSVSEDLIRLSPQARFYRLKGIALVEMVRRGESPDREQAISDATAILQQAKKLDPKNIQTIWYMAQAVMEKGDILATKGMSLEKDKSMQQAQAMLKQAIAAAPNDPNGYIYMLGVQSKSLADKGKGVETLTDDYIALTKKFAANAEVFAATAGHYSIAGDLDKALAASIKANQLDKKNVSYALTTASLYNMKYGISGDVKLRQAAVDMANYGLSLPDSQVVPGPMEWRAKMNRLSLNTFVANCYLNSLMDMDEKADKAQRQTFITAAEKAAYEINQIIGSGDDPFVMNIEGLLTYVKGDKALGIKKMYTAYEKLKQSDTGNQNTQLGELSYALAKAYQNTSEIGSRHEFLFNALSRGKYRTKPDALLEYSELCINLRSYEGAINALNMYDKFVKPSVRSQVLRARTLMAAGQLDDADALLTKIDSNELEVLAVKFSLLQLKSDQAMTAKNAQGSKDTSGVDTEIKKLLANQASIAEKVLTVDPNATSIVTTLIERYIATGQVDQARVFVNHAVSRNPKDTTLQIYRQLLAEKDPAQIGQQRRAEITEAVVKQIPSELQKSLSLADIYRSRQEYDKAIPELKKAWELDKSNAQLVSVIFETALQAKDYKLADQFVDIAKRDNIDQCQGKLFVARLAIVQKENKDALAMLDSVIMGRPVCSTAYLLRSTANAELGKVKESIEDAKKACSINPLDGSAAKQLANLLYQRDVKLGSSVSNEQQTETRAAIERAYLLNPREWQLLSFYAEYISGTDPQKALSIRQSLQTNVPTIQNAVLLGNMAMRLAAVEKNEAASKAYLEMAGAAYEQGYKIAPENSELLVNYAQYLRVSGKAQNAAQLLSSAKDPNLLWQYYLNAGQFDKAVQILNDLYKKEPKNPLYLRGLLATAQRMNNPENVLKFSQELLTVENTKDNQITQIQSLLEVGMIPQAQKQLAAFREKNPNDTAGLLLEAYVLSRKGEYPRSLELLNKNLSLNDSDVKAWRLRGLIYFMQGKYDEAVNDLQKAKNLGANTRIRLELAKAFFRAKRTEDAINELILAIKEDEENGEPRQMLESVYTQLGRKDALKKFYQDTIAKFPENVFWYNQAGMFYLRQNDAAKATQLFSDAWTITQKPENKNSMTVSAGRASLDGYLQAMILAKQYDQVVATGAKYVDTAYAPIALARMADAKSKVNDNKSALDLYRRALDKSESDDGMLMEVISRMASVVGKDQASAWCEQQLKETPDSAVLNFAMANLAKVAFEYNKALTHIDKVLTIIGEKSSVYNNMLDQKQNILTSAYTKTKDKAYLNQAITIYEKMIKSSSEPQVGAMNNLAYLLASSTDNFNEAAAYAQKAYEAQPTNPNILDTYAYTLLKKGDYAKAAEYVAISLQMFEQSAVAAPAEVYEHLGMIKSKLNKKAEAVTAYKQALELGDQSFGDADKDRIRKEIEMLK